MCPMVRYGTTSRIRYRFGIGTVLALALIPGTWSAHAHAGTLAQLQLPARVSKMRAPMDLCVSVSRTAGCRAAIESALASASARGGPLKSRPAIALAASRTQTVETELDSHRTLAVKFYADPEWKRRATTIAHEGLTLVRVAEGANREFTVGITPHGMLGFALKDTTGQ